MPPAKTENCAEAEDGCRHVSGDHTIICMSICGLMELRGGSTVYSPLFSDTLLGLRQRMTWKDRMPALVPPDQFPDRRFGSGPIRQMPSPRIPAATAGRWRLLCSSFSILASLAVAAPASAEDAPKLLTLEQPGGPVNDKCLPIAPGAGSRELKMRQSFADDFNGAELDTNVWNTHYQGHDWTVENRTLASNAERQIYVDRRFMDSDIQPFVFKDGVLHITANKTPDNFVDKFKGLRYTSGVITTRNNFYQAFGYFEIRARMTRGHAYWPAFWLLRQQSDWPPEIDVFETGGDTPETVDMTTHWKEDGRGKHMSAHCRVQVPGNDKEFHTYGVLWTKERMVYYIDRKPIGQFVTPAGLDRSDRPMYLIANLAVQKNASDKTPTPASLDIDWIAAYKF
jgi:beta-glucanase (GH16 family)